MTYSIIARDAATGEFGVAVQSHYFSVGPIVPWAEAGVGAVATQAEGEPAYGPLGLNLMKEGKSAAEALAELIGKDSRAEHRQVAMIDTSAQPAAHTGERCIAYAGHRTDDGVSVQANMMERATVPEAMLTAYTMAEGDLPERLLAALDAAEAEGGDIRGRQSAAIVVVSGTRTGRPWNDRTFDLRVEDHPEPLRELRRLVTLQRAYKASSDAFELAGKGEHEAAQAAFQRARELAPHNTELLFWLALDTTLRDIDEARRLLGQAMAVDRRWGELVRRLPAAGLFPDNQALIDRLLEGQ